jgi:hypothetical protein
VGILPYKLLNRDVASGRWTLEKNPCISLWFASLSCFLAYLFCFRFNLLGCALVCAGVITLLLIIYKGNSLSLVRDRRQEELEAVFAGSLWRTSLNGGGQQSDRCRLLSGARDRSDQSSSPAWPMTPLAVHVFGDEKFTLVVSPIHPPLGDIKVLSIGIRAWFSDSSLAT